jgi:hypothetical protein
MSIRPSKSTSAPSDPNKSISETMEEGKRAQLKQYNEDGGHFSLVRFVSWLSPPFLILVRASYSASARV